MEVFLDWVWRGNLRLNCLDFDRSRILMGHIWIVSLAKPANLRLELGSEHTLYLVIGRLVWMGYHCLLWYVADRIQLRLAILMGRWTLHASRLHLCREAFEMAQLVALKISFLFCLHIRIIESHAAWVRIQFFIQVETTLSLIHESTIWLADIGEILDLWASLLSSGKHLTVHLVLSLEWVGRCFNQGTLGHILRSTGKVCRQKGWTLIISLVSWFVWQWQWAVFDGLKLLWKLSRDDLLYPLSIDWVFLFRAISFRLNEPLLKVGALLIHLKKRSWSLLDHAWLSFCDGKRFKDLVSKPQRSKLLHCCQSTAHTREVLDHAFAKRALGKFRVGVLTNMA